MTQENPHDGDGLYRAIGRVEGRLESLDEFVRDERDRVRLEHAKFTARLEVIEVQLNGIVEVHKSMQSQIYSNKHGIEGVSDGLGKIAEDMNTFKALYAKGLGAIAVLGLCASLVLTGTWWAVWHWGELNAAIRALIKP